MWGILPDMNIAMISQTEVFYSNNISEGERPMIAVCIVYYVDLVCVWAYRHMITHDRSTVFFSKILFFSHYQE